MMGGRPGHRVALVHDVWLYYRFPLNYRDVQELLCERGIDVKHEASSRERGEALAGCGEAPAGVP